LFTSSKDTPQSYLDALLKSRGYSTKRYFVHQSAYYNKVTKIQQISYHAHIVDLVKKNDIDELQSLFATGLSTNPSSSHGQGLIHLVCRLGAADVLQVMIDAGCDIQVSDDYGRTPIHDACWTNYTNCTFKLRNPVHRFPSSKVLDQTLTFIASLCFVTASS
jgi:hypothetical protein